jgi:hypothetical protein
VLDEVVERYVLGTIREHIAEVCKGRIVYQYAMTACKSIPCEALPYIPEANDTNR